MAVHRGFDIWPTCTAVRELAALLKDADLAVLPRAGHFPWVDDPAVFAATVEGFLLTGALSGFGLVGILPVFAVRDGLRLPRVG